MVDIQVSYIIMTKLSFYDDRVSNKVTRQNDLLNVGLRYANPTYVAVGANSLAQSCGVCKQFYRLPTIYRQKRWA